MNKKNIGFTLIELLVVIAIIGILSGAVLINLNNESKKANDARVKSGLAQIRTRMESMRAESATLVYPTWTSVTDVPTAEEVTKIKNDIAAQGSALRIYSSAGAWCAEANLKGGGEFCVDSRGFAGAATTTACTNANQKCQ